MTLMIFHDIMCGESSKKGVKLSSHEVLDLEKINSITFVMPRNSLNYF